MVKHNTIYHQMRYGLPMGSWSTNIVVAMWQEQYDDGTLPHMQLIIHSCFTCVSGSLPSAYVRFCGATGVP